MKETRIGISGWTYAPWRGVFYPKDLPHKRELEHASRHLNSIEINGSFYSLQRPNNYDAWYDATPQGFVFSVKGGRFITHMKKLKDVEVPLANFFASGVLKLKEKLGPFLWQFPPGFAFNEQRFESFFAMLPRTAGEAAKLSRRHDARLKGRAWTKAHEPNFALRHCVEIRHESFREQRFIRLCEKHDVALVLADTAGKWPYLQELTASDFAYVRLHGDEELYVSGYTTAALDDWAKKIELWRRKRDVYVYFDNDVKVRAPFDAMNLAARLGVGRAAEVPETIGSVAELPRTRWPGFRRRQQALSRGKRKSPTIR